MTPRFIDRKTADIISEINQAAPTSTLPQNLQNANIIATLDAFKDSDRANDAEEIAKAMRSKAEKMLTEEGLKPLNPKARVAWEKMKTLMQNYLGIKEEISL